MAEDGQYRLRDLFTLPRPEAGQVPALVWTGQRSLLADRLPEAARRLITAHSRDIFS